MAGLPNAEATRLVDALTGKATYTATVTPLMGRLCSTVGTASTAGTELSNSGGSTYSAQSVTAVLGTTSNGVITNTGTLNYTNLPTVTTPGVQSIEFYDSAGTPVRKAFAALTAAKITALGDAISFAPGALSIAMA
jgi:hypothetical protein